MEEKGIDKEILLRMIEELRGNKQAEQTKLYEYICDEPACIGGQSLEAILSRVSKGNRAETLLNDELKKLEPFGLMYEWKSRTDHHADFQVSDPLKADIEAKDWSTHYRKTTNHVKKNILNKKWRRGTIRIAAFKRDPLLQGKTLYLLDRAKVHILTFREPLWLLQTLLLPTPFSAM